MASRKVEALEEQNGCQNGPIENILEGAVKDVTGGFVKGDHSQFATLQQRSKVGMAQRGDGYMDESMPGS